MSTNKPKRLIDVRSEVEFEICQIPGFINAPLDVLVSNPQDYLPLDPDIDTFAVCRLGNDSQIAADALRSLDQHCVVKDMIGGLKAWAKHVDNNFPIY